MVLDTIKINHIQYYMIKKGHIPIVDKFYNIIAFVDGLKNATSFFEYFNCPFTPHICSKEVYVTWDTMILRHYVYVFITSK